MKPPVVLLSLALLTSTASATLSSEDDPFADITETTTNRLYVRGAKEWPLPTSDTGIKVCRGDKLKDCTEYFWFPPVNDGRPGSNSNTAVRSCYRWDNPQKKMSIGLGRDLNCTLFFSDNCSYGSKGADVAYDGYLINKYPEVMAPVLHPGIGTFEGDDWKRLGLQTKRSKGEPAKSIYCTSKTVFVAGLGLGY